MENIEESAILNSQEMDFLLKSVDSDILLHDFDANETKYFPNYDVKPNILPSPPIPSIISSEEYAGPYNFEVFIDPHQHSRNPWVYSSTLHKVFILVNNLFPVDFKWNQVDMDVYVKATPVFCLPQYAQELVKRCIPHSLPSDKTNKEKPPNVWPHIMRCQNPNAIYVGDLEQGQHLAVVVPLGKPQSGTEVVRQMYEFVCKNSCPSGMNRKALQIIFTLEDDRGNILGRRSINVRICSCPKRDKEKEEKDEKDIPSIPQGKKRKFSKKPHTSNEDNKDYTIHLSVCGKERYQGALKLLHDFMCGEIERTGSDQPCRKTLNQIKELMNKPLE